MEEILNMAYCINCGSELPNSAKFCSCCGHNVVDMGSSPITLQQDIRTTTYDGVIHKCPNCGELFGAFQTVCIACGYEVRGNSESNAVAVFSERLRCAQNEAEQIKIVSSFAIPNNQEDILEFMIIASSNFDEKIFVEKSQEYDLTDAWMSKIESCYEKAKVYVIDARVKELVESRYREIKSRVKKESNASKRNKVMPVILIGSGLLLIMTQIIMIQTLGLVLLGWGIAWAVKNSSKAKKDGAEQVVSGEQVQKTDARSPQISEKGFSSWPMVGKIFWVILNIYTLGIPAIIYACRKKD